jgi:hypothetical protein
MGGADTLGAAPRDTRPLVTPGVGTSSRTADFR